MSNTVNACLLMPCSGVMTRILEKLPVDDAVLDDTIEAGLCKGDIIQVGREADCVRACGELTGYRL